MRCARGAYHTRQRVRLAALRTLAAHTKVALLPAAVHFAHPAFNVLLAARRTPQRSHAGGTRGTARREPRRTMPASWCALQSRALPPGTPYRARALQPSASHRFPLTSSCRPLTPLTSAEPGLFGAGTRTRRLHVRWAPQSAHQKKPVLTRTHNWE